MTTRSDPDQGRLRLQKVLAAAGVGSRRACEELIRAGRVEVDGVVVDELGSRVDPVTAVVRVDGKRVVVNPERVYLAVNKPRGYLSAMTDDRGRRTLADLVPDHGPRLFHVGRLDADTEGLIILTNDGDLAQRIAHPSYEIAKTYVADVEGTVTRETVRHILAGVELDDGPVRASACRVVDRAIGRSLVELVIHEGRNRIVRRLFDELGHPVRGLVRTAIDGVRLGDLPSGETRELQRGELAALLDAAPVEVRADRASVEVRAKPWVEVRAKRASKPASKPTDAKPTPKTSSTIVIAVDGPSGSGKSTVARAVAGRLGLRYLDTGAMYRAVTWAVRQRGVDSADSASVGAIATELDLQIGTDPNHPRIAVGNEDVTAAIREPRVTRQVSAVSAVPEVRAAMVARQRRIIGSGGIVVEGRDIAAVVAPGAAVKVYLTADPATRARRRAAEEDADHVSTEAELARRDGLDSTRTASPLTRSPEATLIDATDLSADEVVALVLDLVAASDAAPRSGSR